MSVLRDIEVVRAAGEVDIETAPDLSARMRRAIAETEGGIVLDLTSVGLIDSSGLAVLLNALRRMTRAGRPLALVVAPGPVARALAITRLDGTFRVYDSLDAATDWMRGLEG